VGLKESSSTSDLDRLLQKLTQLAIASNALAIIYEYSEKAAHDDDGGSIMYQDQISKANLKTLAIEQEGQPNDAPLGVKMSGAWVF
jgi:hypothetical protein